MVISRTYPAVDIVFQAPAAGVEETRATADGVTVPGSVAALLYDLEPAAIHELDGETPPRWRVFFASRAQRDAASEALTAAVTDADISIVSVDVPDEDWAARSQAALRAVRVGSLIVAPPWDVPSGSGIATGPGALVVVIRPSTGFGTGHHESTRLCLEVLQAEDLRGRRVIDVGTGSGVLALAAARLGAADVVAIDADGDAIESARENAVLNGLEHAVTFVVADLRGFAGAEPADLVIANLTGGLLVTVAAQLASLARPGGTIIVSGFQVREADGVLEAFGPHARAVARADENGWEAAALRRV
jgi:ribosomal protein L11 methyltransferase